MPLETVSLYSGVCCFVLFTTAENVNAAHCSQEGDGKNWESAGTPEAMLHRIHYLHRCANYQLNIARHVHRGNLLVRDHNDFVQAGIGSGVRTCLFPHPELVCTKCFASGSLHQGLAVHNRLSAVVLACTHLIANKMLSLHVQVLEKVSDSASPSKRSLSLSDAPCMPTLQETPTEKDAADDMAGHLRVLWKKVELMRRFPVDEEDDASDDSDASDADSCEEAAANDHAAADVADIEQLVARVEAVEDEVLVLKTRAAGSDSYPPVRFLNAACDHRSPHRDGQGVVSRRCQMFPGNAI